MRQSNFDAQRLPQGEACVMRCVLDRHAAEQPDAVFAVFADDLEEWSYAQVRQDVRRLASLLRGLGVEPGEHVAVWMPNSKLSITAWFAINYIGAVYVPLNLAYRGGILQHAVALSDARVMFCHSALADRLEEISLGKLQVLVTETASQRPVASLRLVDADDESLAVLGAAELDVLAPPGPWDVQAIIFTSGTTGPSKGVLVTYAHLYIAAGSHPFRLSSEERTLLYAPMFHIAGVFPVIRALVTGGSIAVLERFVTATFWKDILRTKATFASVMGATTSFLLAQPPSDEERATTLRTLLVSPLTPQTQALAARIGADFYTNFSMSETALPIVTPLNPTKTGICGKPRLGVQVRIVDEFDREAPPGEAGELILRTDVPWTITPGYYKDPAATARAWRNGWFHTGDVVRFDEDGDMVFVDRLKDAIRRRGENISSFEVEVEVRAHPDVLDCAAVAARSQLGEEEVLVVVELNPGSTLSELELFEFLRPRMAHFMLPRYIRFAPLLRTPTEKVQKVALREAGVCVGTWDREAAGIRVKRDSISKNSRPAPDEARERQPASAGKTPT